MTQDEKPSASNKELQDEILKLKEQIHDATIENSKLRMVIAEEGINAELEMNGIGDTEAICTLQIRRLKDKSIYSDLSESDAKILDILHRNLRQAKGIDKNNKRGAKQAKVMENADLLKLVDGE